jgi:thymidylate kinase
VQPTGLVVLVAGPDGAGKTTVATALPEACEGLFRRHVRQHTRPKVLPRPGALLGKKSRDWSRPHDSIPHGRFVSHGLLLYYWLDFFLGGWVRIRPARVRTGLVLVERGWWDLAVDPRRYRLQVPASAVRALGRFLPQPDLALVLDAPADAIRARKRELTEDEMIRQGLAWEDALPNKLRRVRLDASQPLNDVVRAARDEIVQVLEQRAISRLGRGWLDVPRPGRGERTTTSASTPPRLILARGPRAAAVRSLLMYQPCTFRGRMAWEGARLLAGFGGFRLLPRGEGPPRALREMLAPHLPRRSTYAVAESNDPGRFVAAVINEHGEACAVAKIALEAEGRQALEREGDALIAFARFLAPPLSVPRVLLRDEGILLLQPVIWRPRRRPWMLPLEVARGLGAFYQAGIRSGHAGLTHGDVAPWNLLRTDREWVLTDWEEAGENGEPFADLFHYLVQAHLNLRRPSRQAFLEGLDGKGHIGSAVREYSAELGVDIEAARPALVSYLARSCSSLDAATPAGRVQLIGRQELLEALEA